MQAVIILAHNNIEQLFTLVKFLKKKFLVYIHIDKKVKVSERIRKKFSDEGIMVRQLYQVHWGGFSVAAATIAMMREVAAREDITYIHLISGQDWPVQNVQNIYDFYENNHKIYMIYDLVGETKKSGEKLKYWQQFYFNYDKINRKSLFGKVYHRFLLFTQMLLGVNKLKRNHFNLTLYQGPEWVDLPMDAVRYLLCFLKGHPEVLRVFRTSFCSDEFLIQTILCNNEKMRKRIVQDYHRYIVWEHRDGNYPAVLDERDFDQIIAGDYHFARKFEFPKSQELAFQLEKYYNY